MKLCKNEIVINILLDSRLLGVLNQMADELGVPVEDIAVKALEIGLKRHKPFQLEGKDWFEYVVAEDKKRR